MTTNAVARIALGAAAASLSVTMLTACASSSHKSSGGGGASAGSSALSASLKTESTSIGTVSADSNGHTLYELVGDSSSSSKCTGGCLAIWPAVMAGGTRVVLQGHPAYTYSGDSAAGQVHGQGVKDQWGTWYALDASGKPITSSGSSGGSGSSSSSSSGGGGYGY